MTDENKPKGFIEYILKSATGALGDIILQFVKTFGVIIATILGGYVALDSWIDAKVSNATQIMKVELKGFQHYSELNQERIEKELLEIKKQNDRIIRAMLNMKK